MDADKAVALPDEGITDQILSCFYEVYNELGSGFLESVYANALGVILTQRGCAHDRECILPVRFRGRLVGEFKADLVVEKHVVVELKAVSQLARIHEVQLVNYLKATGLTTGLLLNFGPRAEFRRRVFSSHAVDPRPSALIRVEKSDV
jgi:GxxExxY protein